ncbi:hypothetical protein ACTXJM_11230 [Corynebacterium variabile]|uniref:hypothetical protein n=1 Tax=Corynebacterium variabile TaxID=1727 RepID=UPI003BB61627
MTIRRIPAVLAAAAVALALAPSAQADTLSDIYSTRGAVTEANPLGVPEPTDIVGDSTSMSRSTYATFMGAWWGLQDYMRPNCARHVTNMDALLWYNEPGNVAQQMTDDYYPQPYVSEVLHHYPAKTAKQCAAENPTATAPTGSISGSLAGLGL